MNFQLRVRSVFLCASVMTFCLGIVGSAFVVGLVHVSPASGQGLDGGSRLMAVSWTDPASGHGMVRGFSTSAPFGYETPPLVVGADSVLRYALGRVYAVSSADGTITVIDPDNPWVIEQVYSLGAGSEPKDIAVVGPRTAYVTRGSSAQLLRLDLLTGNTEDAADFGWRFLFGKRKGFRRRSW